MTRQWRSDQGYLIERPATVSVIGQLLTASKRAWDRPPMDYWLVDESGGLRQHFTVVVGSLEDELSATLFAVENHALVRLQVRELYGGQSSVDRLVEIDRLVEVPADDQAGVTRRQIAVANERARQGAMNRRGEARLATIPPAQAAYDAGDAFRAAQHSLEWRITQYDDSLSESVLRALLRFGDLCASAPAIKPALDLYVEACRLVSQRGFQESDATAPSVVGVVWMSVRQREQAAELAADLRDIEHELKVDADIQEQVDAHLNAAALWHAARRVAETRWVLATMLERAP